eukprot:CAMPEP_0119570410 /NCGR_PEP_ID=MMETSP1352-20130426/43599_1 /TAXON_ID=265584 /ORGANISM="Stauroneis constricta, Strain CCMP1120" /LENGTH=1379 /DNA_ID=CAMNT_0007620079 /DNA_START=442 /DNA_END=4582 /DNA_ORIENTATION=-
MVPLPNHSNNGRSPTYDDDKEEQPPFAASGDNHRRVTRSSTTRQPPKRIVKRDDLAMIKSASASRVSGNNNGSGRGRHQSGNKAATKTATPNNSSSSSSSSTAPSSSFAAAASRRGGASKAKMMMQRNNGSGRHQSGNHAATKTATPNNSSSSSSSSTAPSSRRGGASKAKMMMQRNDAATAAEGGFDNRYDSYNHHHHHHNNGDSNSNIDKHHDFVIDINDHLEDMSVGTDLPPVSKKSEQARNKSFGGGGGTANNKFVQRETVLVNRSKLVVYIVILLSAALTGGVTYYLLKEDEKSWYKDEFEEFAEEVFETTQGDVAGADASIRSLADAWTTRLAHDDHVHHEDSSFTSVLVEEDDTKNFLSHANVTFPNFGVQAKNFAILGKARMVAVAPLVAISRASEWESYAVENQGWIKEDLMTHTYHDDRDDGGHQTDEEVNPGMIHETILPKLSDEDLQGASSYRLPIWQLYPAPSNAAESPIMLDLLSFEWFRVAWETVLDTRAPALSQVLSAGSLEIYAGAAQDDSSDDEDTEQLREQPLSILVEPIFDTFEPDAPIVGVTVAVLLWNDYFNGVLEGEAVGMMLDLQYTCPTSLDGATVDDTKYTFRTMQNAEVIFMGTDIQQDSEHDSIAQRERIFPKKTAAESAADSSDDRRLDSDSVEDDGDEEQGGEVCGYYLSIHATDEFVEYWGRTEAVTYTIVVVSIFFFTGMVFIIYDFLVQRRNQKLTQTAERSNAVVTSLFPQNVAEQILQETEQKATTPAQSLREFSLMGKSSKPVAQSKPIADLFSDTTILFADIVGFTAWSSMREPTQVFKLLETIFNAFDTIADYRSVFKVETVGDCYVAVCGLPEPRKDHAINMARFARDCLIEMGNLTKELELELGPDTSNLSMRFGMHSGPVTAGVLRGQRARFQLFGDTMNTASRIETTGRKGRIHISKETAEILIASGKRHWVKKREDRVIAKGLGELQTYWLQIQGDDTHSTTSESLDVSSSHYFGDHEDPVQDTEDFFDSYKRSNLVNWHSETLGIFLRKVIASRDTSMYSPPAKTDTDDLDGLEQDAVLGHAAPSNCIKFPTISAPIDGNSIALDPIVAKQLKMYVREVSSAYHSHPFHNFEHASHVVMSVTKLLSHMEYSEISLDDPLTQFTLIFTALIHDIDHPGVSNKQLQAEESSMAAVYKSSIAERNSLDIAWKLLMRDTFKELRRTIYTTTEEFERFKELLIHALLVTDIVNKDLQTTRKQRWNEVFGEASSESLKSLSHEELSNHQKTAVLEHIIQASDVAHTMQHWNVYRRWNGSLFHETYRSFKDGRSEDDPLKNWYQGEIGFFDFYIIPLAQRLKQCPAFGATGQELLRYAKSNRDEWERKGKDVVKKLKESVAG